MQIKRIFLGLVIAFALNSCINTIDGNGKITKEQRTVSSFNKIDISGGYEVLINQGDKEQLNLEVDENLLEYIKTETKNNTLYISSKEAIESTNSLKLYITVVNVKAIDVSGAIKLKNKGSYKTSSLTIKVSGAGDVDLDVNVENLTMEMSGASETTLSGNATNFKIEISGAGKLKAKELKTSTTNIEISGAGSAVVHAKKTLKVSVSGAGNVKYKGNPEVEQDISGAGSIEKL